MWCGYKGSNLIWFLGSWKNFSNKGPCDQDYFRLLAVSEETSEQRRQSLEKTSQSGVRYVAPGEVCMAVVPG